MKSELTSAATVCGAALDSAFAGFVFIYLLVLVKHPGSFYVVGGKWKPFKAAFQMFGATAPAKAIGGHQVGKYFLRRLHNRNHRASLV